MDKIVEYFNTKAVSNSLLRSLNNPRWIKIQRDNPDTENEDAAHFRMGATLDCLLTDPTRWDKEFIVVDATRPYGFMGKFVDNLPSGLTELSSQELYQEAYDKAGYRMAINKVIDKFWSSEDIIKYYKLTRNIEKHKRILSKDEFDIVVKCKELIEANKFTKAYFVPENSNIEILYQVPIYFKYKDIDCKALLDGIVIDHENKTIQPYDLKTTKNISEFSVSYMMYGYYSQCALYEVAIQTDSSPVKKYIDKGYTILDFKFIAVENKLSSTYPAIIFNTSKADREKGLKGGEYKGKFYKGIDQLIEDYKIHTELDYWDLPMDLFFNNGIRQLNVFDNDTKE